MQSKSCSLQLEDYTAFKDRLACSLSQASIALDIVAIDNMHAANPAENMATRIEAVRELLLPIIQEGMSNLDASLLKLCSPRLQKRN